MGDFSVLARLDNRRLAPSLAVAVLLHALTVAELGRLGSRWQRPPATAPAATPPIRLRLVDSHFDRPRIEPRSAAAPSSNQPPTAPPRRIRPASRPAAAAAPSPLRYDQLLPANRWPTAPGADTDAGNAAGRPPRVAQGLQIATEELSGKLDIPLVFRAGVVDAKAVAKIKRADTPGASAGLLLEYLDGEPLLRAVLYATLRSPDNQRLVDDWLRRTGWSEIVLSLSVHSLPTDRPPTRQTEEIHFLDHRVAIVRTVYVFDSETAGGPLSLTLPDAEAERAKRRDHMHRQQLLLSPAYRAPLRNHPLAD